MRGTHRGSMMGGHMTTVPQTVRTYKAMPTNAAVLAGGHALYHDAGRLSGAVMDLLPTLDAEDAADPYFLIELADDLASAARQVRQRARALMGLPS